MAEPKLKLVVPTNFSKKSEMALDFALVYSQNHNADVYVFHAFEEKSRDYREIDRLNVEYMERMKQAVLAALDRVASRGIRIRIEDVHRRISQGKAAHEILKLAAGVFADMIVMGAPSSKHFKELVNNTPCTLVLVKEKDQEFYVP